MSSRLQNLLIVLGLVTVAGLGYYLYTENQSSELSFDDGPIASEVQAESTAVLRQLNEIQDIELNTSILRDPRLQSFQNNRLPVQPAPIGRVNPFTP